MTDTPMNKREGSKAATRRKVLETARALFAELAYEEVTIRLIAERMAMSTGAIYANFADKAALWKAAMGTEPPVDSLLTRAAGPMLDALKAVWAVRPANWNDGEDPEATLAWLLVGNTIALAGGPQLLDERQAEAA